jgi:hypothetical protein
MEVKSKSCTPPAGNVQRAQRRKEKKSRGKGGNGPTGLKTRSTISRFHKKVKMDIPQPPKRPVTPALLLSRSGRDLEWKPARRFLVRLKLQTPVVDDELGLVLRLGFVGGHRKSEVVG